MSSNVTHQPITAAGICKLLFCCVLLINVICIVYFSTFLRPGADDYCWAANVAEYGVFGGVLQWWKTWCGFVSATFLANLFVGLPFTHLNPALISAVPFVIGLFLVGTISLYISPFKMQKARDKCFVFLFMCLGWWLYLWTPDTIGIKELLTKVAEGITHWQNLNGNYVIGTTTLTLLALTLRNRFLHVRTGLFIVVLHALIVGTFGPALALGVLLFVCAINIPNIFFLFSNKQKFNKTLFYYSTLYCIILIPTVCCVRLYSPGEHIRQARINPDLTFSIERALDLCTFIGIQLYRKTAQIIASYSAIYIFIFSVTVGCVFQEHLKIKDYNQKFKDILYYLIIFYICITCASLVGEFFTYAGYWHMLISSLCAFYILAILGLYVSLYISKYRTIQRLMFPCLAICAICVCVINAHALDKIYDRYTRWERGPASTRYVTDIDNSDGWQKRCWDRLNQCRKEPIKRGMSTE